MITAPADLTTNQHPKLKAPLFHGAAYSWLFRDSLASYACADSAEEFSSGARSRS